MNTLPFLELDDVTTLRLDEVGVLEAKIRLELEREEPNGKFLLYAPTEEGLRFKILVCCPRNRQRNPIS